ncbi:hypothetical protein D1872_219730 [compost metagenome]
MFRADLHDDLSARNIVGDDDLIRALIPFHLRIELLRQIAERDERGVVLGSHTVIFIERVNEYLLARDFHLIL